MTKNSNGIIKSMVIIAEKFRVLNITEDDLIEAADAQTYLHLFENVEDFRQKEKLSTAWMSCCSLFSLLY